MAGIISPELSSYLYIRYIFDINGNIVAEVMTVFLM